MKANQEVNNIGSLKLSICIATYNRGQFIGETLDTILSQMEPGVELIVVDGASPDNTQEVMAQYLLRFPKIRYYRELENSGIDRDYDKAVGYARGEFCWLMTDDDLLKPSALQQVLAALNVGSDLIVVNAEVKNSDLSEVLEPRMLNFPCDRRYQAHEREQFFSDVANYLSFIGCVVIRRELWLGRDRKSYYGSLFVHVGVIFQSPPVDNVFVIANPLITIRYGNAMWTPRGFEIWMLEWPELVWSFPDFTSLVKETVRRREPWRRVMTLLYYRATGAYTLEAYRRFLSGRTNGLLRYRAYLVGLFPPALANLLGVAYLSVSKGQWNMALYDLQRSRHATSVGRWLEQILKGLIGKMWGSKQH